MVEVSVGPIDLWFANAGLAGGKGLDAPDSTWERQWQVNVMAHVYASRALLPRWLARGEGHLVTTGIRGWMARPRSAWTPSTP